MEPDNMPPRQSIDSTRSTSPLIQSPVVQPPPNYPESHDNEKGRVLVFLTLALISGLAIGVKFAMLGAHRVEMILLIILTWVSAVWNGLMLISLHKSSFRISLVLSNGEVIGFGPQSGGEGDHRGHRCPGAFWVDLLLGSAVFSLNLANSCEGIWYHRTALALNWVPIAFHLIVVLLTVSSALFAAHVRFEIVEMPEISLA
ncbi:hypothetical protein F5B21DRAFT_507816 [Xylaria acuta]|nr:hypothetical protein F5B21DRAFT_507816 [Xylaria acuta]